MKQFSHFGGEKHECPALTSTPSVTFRVNNFQMNLHSQRALRDLCMRLNYKSRHVSKLTQDKFIPCCKFGEMDTKPHCSTSALSLTNAVLTELAQIQQCDAKIYQLAFTEECRLI